MLAEKAELAFGGGGDFGIWLADGLEHGHCGACETFEGWEASGGFRIVDLEVWSFLI